VRQSNAALYMFDPRSLSLMCLARSHWLTGDLDRAQRYSEMGLEDAERSDHPVAMFRAFAVRMALYFWTDDLLLVERNLAKLELISEKNSLGPYRAVALGLRGRYLLRIGRIAEGMQHLRDALKRLAAQRYRMWLQDFAADLAVCLAKQNDRAEALALVDEVIAGQREVNMVIHLPALLMTKGRVCIHGHVPDLRSAQEYFERSMAVAREQSALSYEMRAGLELAGIWTQIGEVRRARDMIGPIYSRFSEGFGTPDLIRAREILGAP